MKEIDFEVEKKRQKEEEKAEEKRLRRAENKKRAREAMEAGLPPPTLEDLRRRADDRAETHEAKRLAKLDDRMGGDPSFDADDARAAGDNDSSRRAYYKEFVKVVEASDVVVQVLDARDPLAQAAYSAAYAAAFAALSPGTPLPAPPGTPGGHVGVFGFAERANATPRLTGNDAGLPPGWREVVRDGATRRGRTFEMRHHPVACPNLHVPE